MLRRESGCASITSNVFTCQLYPQLNVSEGQEMRLLRIMAITTFKKAVEALTPSKYQQLKLELSVLDLYFSQLL